MTETKLENITEVEINENGIQLLELLNHKIIGRVTLEQYGANRHELASDLIKKLCTSLYSDYKDTYTEETAKELLKYIIEDITLKTMDIYIEV